MTKKQPGKMKYGDKDALHFYFHLFKGKRRILTISALLTLLLSLMYIPITLVLRKMLNKDVFGEDISDLLINGTIVIGIFLLTLVINVFNKHLVVHAIKERIRDIRVMLLDKLYELPKSYYSGMDIPEWHTVIHLDLRRIDQLTDALFMRFIPGLLVIFVTSGVLLYINWRLFLILVVLSPMISWILLRARWRLTQLILHWRKLSSTFNQGILFVLNYMELTRLQGAEESEKKKQIHIIDQLTKDEIDNAWISYLYNNIQETLVLCASIVVLIAGGIAVSRDMMTLGDVFTFYIVFMFMRKYIFNMFNSLPNYIRGIDGLQRLKQVLELHEARPYKGEKKIKSCFRIELEDVSFTYSDEPLLEDVNLTIEKGDVVLLQGPNGSGKSTLADLMLGFYKPETGNLYCNGIPYEELDMISLRQNIGMIPQDCPIFYGSIRENLVYGIEGDITESDLYEAAHISSADRFINKMPEKFETFVGEKGKRVSGGQRQKIGLTRALLRRADFLIFDEPTNHLDEETIFHFISSLKNLPDKPAILIISHDVQLATLAEKIYRIEENGLIELEQVSANN